MFILVFEKTCATTQKNVKSHFLNFGEKTFKRNSNLLFRSLSEVVNSFVKSEDFTFAKRFTFFDVC